MNKIFVIQTMGQQHLLAEKNRWEAAIERARALFAVPKQAKLASLFLKAASKTRYYLFGAASKDLKGLFGEQICTNSTVELLEMMDHFINYHLLDDGDPGLAYMELDEFGGYVQSVHHEHSMPYFHRCVEEQREIYPDAKLLTIDDAIEAFEWYEKRRHRYINIYADVPKLVDKCKIYQLTPYEISLGALADELSSQ